MSQVTMKARIKITLKGGVLDPQGKPSKTRFLVSASGA